MNSPRHRSSFCPNCRTLLDASCDPEKKTFHQPKPGDISTCLSCGIFMRFDSALALVQLSDSEFAALSPEQQRKLHLIAATGATLRKRKQYQ